MTISREIKEKIRVRKTNYIELKIIGREKETHNLTIRNHRKNTRKMHVNISWLIKMKDMKDNFLSEHLNTMH